MFTEAEIQERFEDLYIIATEFCEEFNKGKKGSAQVDPSLLYLAVVATYDDISRYKSYHLKNPATQKSSPIKRASFGASWILHFSPIIFPRMGHKSPELTIEDGDVLANAAFALHFAFTNIEIDSGKPFQVSERHYYDLIYDLTYRGMTADSLILHFQTLSDLVSSGDLSPVIDQGD